MAKVCQARSRRRFRVHHRGWMDANVLGTMAKRLVSLGSISPRTDVVALPQNINLTELRFFQSFSG